MKLLEDRKQAGFLLAQKLKQHHPELFVPETNQGVWVLALPRGGVPVAHEIAQALQVPLEVCLVRKLGTPGNRELAMGAIGLGGAQVLNTSVIESHGISSDAIAQITATEEQELHRRDRLYRGNHPWPCFQNQTLILVDDGVATGSTLYAALTLLKPQQPKQIIIAVPVLPFVVYRELQREVDDVVYLDTPEPFYCISPWYEDFHQLSDQEVCDLLHRDLVVP
ncbi:phosphoribosyltransferase [Spirulina subsalsa]|uniref:phosphoribosyltransferase n=1 Tax=Spirulina subsalsa TaxID=54311 RepID=UPI0002EE8623|nr:phosphoribosyltransferase [Spirulina subsalsa]